MRRQGRGVSNYHHAVVIARQADVNIDTQGLDTGWERIMIHCIFVFVNNVLGLGPGSTIDASTGVPLCRQGQ